MCSQNIAPEGVVPDHSGRIPIEHLPYISGDDERHLRLSRKRADAQSPIRIAPVIGPACRAGRHDLHNLRRRQLLSEQTAQRLPDPPSHVQTRIHTVLHKRRIIHHHTVPLAGLLLDPEFIRNLIVRFHGLSVLRQPAQNPTDRPTLPREDRIPERHDTPAPKSEREREGLSGTFMSEKNLRAFGALHRVAGIEREIADIQISPDLVRLETDRLSRIPPVQVVVERRFSRRLGGRKKSDPEGRADLVHGHRPHSSAGIPFEPSRIRREQQSPTVLHKPADEVDLLLGVGERRVADDGQNVILAQYLLIQRAHVVRSPVDRIRLEYGQAGRVPPVPGSVDEYADCFDLFSHLSSSTPSLVSGHRSSPRRDSRSCCKRGTRGSCPTRRIERSPPRSPPPLRGARWRHE